MPPDPRSFAAHPTRTPTPADALAPRAAAGDQGDVHAAVHAAVPADAALVVVRHGLTAWNAGGRWQGWTDVALSDEGEHQATAAAGTLAAGAWRCATVVSSDLTRARATADRLAAAIAVPRRVVDPGWRERDIGDWSGLRTEEIEARWPGMLDTWRAGALATLPGGESEAGLVARIVAAFGRAGREPGPVLVVAHGGVIRTLERWAGVAPRLVPNLGGRAFVRGDDGGLVPASAVDLLADVRAAQPTGVAL